MTNLGARKVKTVHNCNKLKYDSKDQALRFIKTLKEMGHGKLDAYMCSICKAWHIASYGRGL